MLQLADLFVDVSTLPQNVAGFIQLIYLMFTYAYILMVASGMISEGSELLLLVPEWSHLVGSVVLPILGTLPDALIVLFSGMGPDAQEQLDVGIGATAGSTVMLTTISWFVAVYTGRVSYNSNTGQLNYKGDPKLEERDYAGLTTSAVKISPNVQKAGVMLAITGVSYLLLQGPGVFYSGTQAEVAEREKYWALAGLVTCILLFFWYIATQLMATGRDTKIEDLRNKVIVDAILKGEVSLLGVMTAELKGFFEATKEFDQTHQMSFLQSQHHMHHPHTHTHPHHQLQLQHQHQHPRGRVASISEEVEQQKPSFVAPTAANLAAADTAAATATNAVNTNADAPGRGLRRGSGCQRRSSQRRDSLDSVSHESFTMQLRQLSQELKTEKTALVLSEYKELKHKLHVVLRPFFHRYDESNTNTLDAYELHNVMRDIGEHHMDHEDVQDLFDEIDSDGSGQIDFDEFVEGIFNYLQENSHLLGAVEPEKMTAAGGNKQMRWSSFLIGGNTTTGTTTSTTAATKTAGDGGANYGSITAVHNDSDLGLELGMRARKKSIHDITQAELDEIENNKKQQKAAAFDGIDEDDEEDDEDEDVPLDLQALTPEQQQQHIKYRAFKLMFIGTFLLLFFSDPLVRAFDELGKRMGIRSFYIAFICSPFVANAPELIASYNYALKKTSSSISVAQNTLLGSVIVNNTMALGVFMGIIFVKGLAWQYLAETLSILVVEAIAALMALKSVHTLQDALLLLALYPLSLLFVYTLEACGWN